MSDRTPNRSPSERDKRAAARSRDKLRRLDQRYRLKEQKQVQQTIELSLTERITVREDEGNERQIVSIDPRLSYYPPNSSYTLHRPKPYVLLCNGEYFKPQASAVDMKLQNNGQVTRLPVTPQLLRLCGEIGAIQEEKQRQARRQASEHWMRTRKRRMKLLQQRAQHMTPVEQLMQETNDTLYSIGVLLFH